MGAQDASGEQNSAREFFARAAELLPAEDRHSMVAAEIMASIYRGLLGRIERDGFRVFEKEYRLSKLEKAGRIAAQLSRRCQTRCMGSGLTRSGPNFSAIKGGIIRSNPVAFLGKGLTNVENHSSIPALLAGRGWLRKRSTSSL
jgi:hypothetical protein